MDFSKKIIKGVCIKHGEYEYQDIPFANLNGGCPFCIDEKAREMELMQERIKNPKINHSEDALRNMGVQKKYLNASFDTWNCETEKQQYAKDCMIELTEKKSGIVMLMGNNGTRKTTLACAALKCFKSGLIISLYKAAWLVNCREHYDGYVTGFPFLRLLETIPFLVIDEMGRTNCSKAEKNMISDIVREREADELATAFISNYPTKNVAKETYKGLILDNILGSDVMSRLSNAKFCVLDGKDYRRE